MKTLAKETAIRLLELSPDALVIVDGGGRIAYANSAVTHLFGHAAESIRGKGIELLLPDRFRALHARHRAEFAAAPATREMGARTLPLFARRQDGSEFPVEIRLAPVVLPEGLHVMAAIRDATERRRLADEVIAARQRADQANHAKSRFLATASHDLRQPLQTLQLLHAALSRQPGTTPFAALLERQQQALTAMTDLLNVLLDVSKLESGTIEAHPEQLSLRQIVAELRQQFESVASQRGLRLEIDLSATILWTDRVLFRQLLQNLIANALRYTNAGSVTIRSRRDRAEIVLEVEDTGIGIPADKLERIFDEYYQIEPGSSGGKGFGLGLTIVKYISRLLGFKTTVRSQAGVGTCFTVTIPENSVLSEQQPPTLQGARNAPDPARKPSILVVEDDDAVRSALELALSLEGYPTRVAASGAAAEEVFRQAAADIDMVVSDFHLEAGRTGKDVVESLRAIAGRDLPAVFLTGDTSSVVRRVEGVPRSILLSKPADLGKLVAGLEELFGAD